MASLLYKNNISTVDIQRLLGHTTQAMTPHLKNVTADDNVVDKMNEIL